MVGLSHKEKLMRLKVQLPDIETSRQLQEALIKKGIKWNSWDETARDKTMLFIDGDLLSYTDSHLFFDRHEYPEMGWRELMKKILRRKPVRILADIRRHAAEMIPIGGGLCNVARNLNWKGILSAEEVDWFVGYAEELLVPMGYYWKYGKVKPRLKWLDYRIRVESYEQKPMSVILEIMFWNYDQWAEERLANNLSVALCRQAKYCLSMGYISFDEYEKLIDYIGNNRPLMSGDIFYWPRYKTKPRRRWLKRHIKKCRRNEQKKTL